MSKEKLPYKQIADILIVNKEPLSIKKIAVLTGLSIEEIRTVIDAYYNLGLLDNHNNYSEIIIKKKTNN